MTTLAALWDFSLILCAIALLGVLVLLIARVVSARSVEQRTAMRRQLLPHFLAGETVSGKPTRIMRRVAASLTLELAELVRGSDREALIQSARSAGAAEELARRMRARAPADRLVAAEALALFPEFAEAVGALALGDRNPDVRLGAALALAQEGRAPPVAELVHRLGIGTRERSLLVVSLLRDLVRTDQAAVEALLQDPGVPDAAKLTVTDALAESGSFDHAPVVAAMADAPETDPELRPRIIRALGRLGHPAGHRAILAALDSADWPVRAAAAEAAGRSGLRKAAERLGALLDDEQWWVRFRAGEALTRLGAPGRLELHRAALGHHLLAREAAKITLAEQQLA